MPFHIAATLLVSLALAPPGAADPAIEFFEKRIRPVLVERCYECHSAKARKLEGGLRLDSRAGVRKGGETGPAVIPGDLTGSLLLQAIRYEGLEMPPTGKLPAPVIADFEKWVAGGAVDPRSETAAATGSARTIDWNEARKHWSYQPVRRAGLPAVKQADWPTAPIDYFVLSELERNGLSPAAPADRRTLLRRAYFDLVGLPPDYAEIEAFLADSSPDAFERVVERLLASPHYGERWGRHWLDVARYADTKDLVLLYGPDRIRPYSYTYRDYVIRAFNEDTGYDEFIREQLAADRITPPVEPWRLAAMGFLTLGRLFDNNPHDIYDDQIDTVTRGLLGLTVACARCHDHKYDAITMRDYYGLYGVFASSAAPIELPLLGPIDRTPGFADFEAKAAPKRKELQDHIDAQHAMLTETARQRIGDYLVRIATQPPDPLEEAVYYLSLSPEDLRPQVTAAWRRLLERRSRPDDPVFGPWHDLMKLPDGELSARAREILDRWGSSSTLNPIVKRSLSEASITGKADVAKLYGDVLRHVHDEAKKDAKAPDDLAKRELLLLVRGVQSPTYFPPSQAYLYMSRVDRDKYNGLLQEIDKLAVLSADAPPRAMVVVDSSDLYEPRIFVRGNPNRPGETVPRRFLELFSTRPFSEGSGRLELAGAIADPANPLTSRVLVNRVWMHHFGTPLVSSPSDWGIRGDRPTHPELLDYLAWEFPRRGKWSLKWLHRQIVLSSSYRQSSADRPACRQVDPENRLYWRANRRRQDLESMRDSMLAVSGRLDRRLTGRTVDVAGDPFNCRRTVYSIIDRQDLPGMFRVFDFASPDLSTARRSQTTVPQQALFAMNAPFVLEQAKAVASRTAGADEARIGQLFQRALGRSPDPQELESARAFLLSPAGDANLTAWEALAQILLIANEFQFVD